MSNNLAVVAGGGGFIGGHLVATLQRDGMRVRAVDKKPLNEWYQRHDGVENIVGDVGLLDGARAACADATEVYQLAADMVAWAS